MGGKHQPNAKLWKKIVLCGALPGVALLVIKTVLELASHTHERPEFVPYSYLRIRNKRFPWGDGQRTFFHNKKVNALPDGYEEEEEDAVVIDK